MPVTPLATETDLSDALLRPLTADETDQTGGSSRASRDLARAQGLLAGRVVGFYERIASWPDGARSIDPTVAATVIAGIVARKWRNPDGALNRSTTVGPYVEAVGYGERVGGEQVGRGELVVTAGDIAALTQSTGFARGGTIRTTPQFPFAYDGPEYFIPFRPGA